MQLWCSHRWLPIQMAGENAEKFGFVFVPFFKNVSMYNCTRMEWKLQAKYDYLPCTGRRRLWKKTGSGLEYLDKYGKCMVYISLSFKVQGMLDSGKLIRGTPSLTIDNDRREKIGLYSEKSAHNAEEYVESDLDTDDEETSDTDDEETSDTDNEETSDTDDEEVISLLDTDEEVISILDTDEEGSEGDKTDAQVARSKSPKTITDFYSFISSKNNNKRSVASSLGPSVGSSSDSTKRTKQQNLALFFAKQSSK